MKAIQYVKSVPRWLLMRLVGRRVPSMYTGRLALMELRDISPQELPGDDWVRVRPILTGVCGSDLATISAKGSAFFSGILSLPFVFGHEVVGRVTETGAAVDDLPDGTRVVLQPALGCEVRGVEPRCDACARGDFALCRNVTSGKISAGIQTGYCRDTGGAWAESFVAHRSQLYEVPAGVSDESAALIEPLACALHAALRAQVKAEDEVFIIGGGSIGLLITASLRELGFEGRIVVAARHPHQQEHARRLGATEIIASPRDMRERYAAWAEAFGASLHPAELGNPVVLGGASVVFDCVASSQSLDDSFRFTAGGGRLVLVGMPGVPSGVDWTSLWYKEINLLPTYAYGTETVDGERITTFALALKLLANGMDEKLRPLVSEPFALSDYPAAIDAALNTSRSGNVKTVMRLD